ncbi:hypothetical protein JW930_07080 [Candidatus Woesearchaeota archaeon]|nr:hypothetical protein [Candidatus Woesearchaeota archaeon]
MNHEEIDAWYEEEKQRLYEKFEKEVANKKNKERAKQRYKKAMDQLQQKFSRLSSKTTNSDLRKHKFKSYFHRKFINYKMRLAIFREKFGYKNKEEE